MGGPVKVVRWALLVLAAVAPAGLLSSADFTVHHDQPTLERVGMFSGNREGLGAATFPGDASVYLFGGGYGREVDRWDGHRFTLDALPTHLPMGLSGVAAAAWVDNGQKSIYLFGGTDGRGNYQDAVLRFSVDTNGISVLGAALHALGPLRSFAQAVTLPTGIYVMGGCPLLLPQAVGCPVLRFDPKSQSLSSAEAVLPGGLAWVPARAGTAFPWDHRILYVGGENQVAAAAGVPASDSDRAYVFDPTVGVVDPLACTCLGVVPLGGFSHASGLAEPGGRNYVFGGSVSDGYNERQPWPPVSVTGPQSMTRGVWAMDSPATYFWNTTRYLTGASVDTAAAWAADNGFIFAVDTNGRQIDCLYCGSWDQIVKETNPPAPPSSNDPSTAPSSPPSSPPTSQPSTPPPTSATSSPPPTSSPPGSPCVICFLQGGAGAPAQGPAVAAHASVMLLPAALPAASSPPATHAWPWWTGAGALAGLVALVALRRRL
ncbi:MAG: Kelch repeat-containing protein [Thermoplasmatota archaeon]